MHLTKDDIDNIEFEVIQKIFKEKLLSLGFKVREPQLEMAKEILEMFKNGNKCLIVEAGVGTGKSFGYLIPLLVLQKYDRFGFSIVISTGTISLQEQLIKDIYFLIDKLNLQTNVVLAKGKTHFLCQDRLEKHYGSNNLPKWATHWKDYSAFGDRADLNDIISDIDSIWDNINVQDCKFRRCRYYDECKFIKLRQNMRQNNSIIVTNHDQLIANAKLIEDYRKPLFPDDTEIIVVDEAHNLEEKARNALTESWSKYKTSSLLRKADIYLRKYDNYKETKSRKERIEKLLDQLFQKLELHCNQEISKNEKLGQETQRFSLPTIEESFIEELVNELESYNISLQLLETQSEDFDETVYSIESLIDFIGSIIYDNNKVFWIETNNQGKSKISINSAPKKMNEIISNYFFSTRKPYMILTSATISQPGADIYDKYDYIITTLGIDSLTTKQLALSEPKLSPFNYKENALLYIPSSLPSPKDIDNFRLKSIGEIVNLLKLTDGRSMILFTSKNDMQFIHNQLTKLELPWKILLQKEGSSQDKVKQEFIEDENSVLLATGIFWEGIDIPGPSLSNLIIFKLPFPVPDPILKYKESISSNGSLGVYLPEMLIKLRQGLGRLIRRETDKGIATILDSRISTTANKSYRDLVINSLPFDKITEDFEEVKKFVKTVLKF
jgi:ATP-dependent DNA helicase DinG